MSTTPETSGAGDQTMNPSTYKQVLENFKTLLEMKDKMGDLSKLPFTVEEMAKTVEDLDKTRFISSTVQPTEQKDGDYWYETFEPHCPEWEEELQRIAEKAAAAAGGAGSGAST